MRTGPDTDTSVTLLERIQDHPEDPRAWQMFVERYQPKIRRWCLAWGLQDSDADDVTQDVLVKLFGALRKFRYDPDKGFHAWLRTVAQHVWFDFLSARRKDPGHNADSLGHVADSAEAQSDLERQIEEAFERDLLDMAMDRVRGRVKSLTWDAFHLTAVGGLSGAEAAQRLGMPVAHVFVAKHRVQKMLQEEVGILRDGRG